MEADVEAVVRTIALVVRHSAVEVDNVQLLGTQVLMDSTDFRCHLGQLLVIHRARAVNDEGHLTHDLTATARHVEPL